MTQFLKGEKVCYMGKETGGDDCEVIIENPTMFDFSEEYTSSYIRIKEEWV